MCCESWKMISNRNRLWHQPIPIETWKVQIKQREKADNLEWFWSRLISQSNGSECETSLTPREGGSENHVLVTLALYQAMPNGVRTHLSDYSDHPPKLCKNMASITPICLVKCDFPSDELTSTRVRSGDSDGPTFVHIDQTRSAIRTRGEHLHQSSTKEKCEILSIGMEWRILGAFENSGIFIQTKESRPQEASIHSCVWHWVGCHISNPPRPVSIYLLDSDDSRNRVYRNICIEVQP